MTIEDIYFPKDKNKIKFDPIVREIGSLITHFTVDSVIPTDELNRCLSKGDGRRDGVIHSKGAELYFAEYTSSHEFVFEIKFEGEGKRFRITFEVSGASPNGILTYMVEPDEKHVLFSKIKSFLKSTSGGSTKYEAVSIFQEKVESIKAVVKEPESELDGSSKIRTEEKIIVQPIEEGRRCACPTESDEQLSDDVRDMEMYSSRFRKLYYKSYWGYLGIYSCEMCGNHFMIEKQEIDRGGPLYFLECLTKETTDYLISMEKQLDVIIEDKGVNIVRVMLLNGAK